jgi:preprotein translocase subunit SecY
MVSAAEQMAANMSWGTLGKAKDLQGRILFALLLLIVYRIGTYIPVPGVDAEQLRTFFEQNSQGIGGMLNMFTGGAVGRMAIFALGIMPYITSSIIMQLLTSMVPYLEQLKKEGEQGRQKVNQYTRYGTVVLALFQSWGIAVGIEAQGLASDPGLFFKISCVVTLVGGTMLLMWLGEQITQRGIGNGISLIIFVGIVAELPGALGQFFSSGRSGALSAVSIISLIIVVVGVIAFVVFVERSLRKVPLQYPRRQVGMKIFEGENSNLPVKLNPAGVIPAIFASSLLLLPTTLTAFSTEDSSGIVGFIAAYIGPGQVLYYLFFGGMIIFFAYFYTLNVSFKPEDVAENIKKQGGFVPGIRPGLKTAQYLEYVVVRILVVGSMYLAAVCLLPEFLRAQLNVPFYFGGTSVLIVVSVTLDTVAQLQSHLLAHQYEGLIEKSRLGKKNKRQGRFKR